MNNTIELNIVELNSFLDEPINEIVQTEYCGMNACGMDITLINNIVYVYSYGEEIEMAEVKISD